MNPNKVALCLGVLACLGLAPVDPAAAQSSPQVKARPLPPGPPRWIENYDFLADPEKRTDFWDPIRYISLGDGTYLSLGGEARARYDYFDNPAFGLRGTGQDDFLLTRAMLHGSLHVGDMGRAFLQLSNTLAWDKDQRLSPTDQSRTEIHQAFIDLNIPAPGNGTLTLRPGRQEVPLGKTRLSTNREGPNERLSHDGVRLMYRSPELTGTAFVMQPLELNNDSFDDVGNDEQWFAGTYWTTPLVKEGPANFSADVYGFYLERDQATINTQRLREERYTVGTRLFGKYGNFDVDAEAMYQFGKFGSADIAAYAFASHSGYTFADTAWQPRLGLRLDVASGDDDRGDGSMNTFNPMFPNNGLYSGSGLITMANLIAVGPSLTVKPAPKVTALMEVYQLWRESGDDVVYVPGLVTLPRTNLNDERELGQFYKLVTSWRATSNLTVAGELSYYDIASALRKAGGDDVTFLSVKASYKF